MIRGLLKRLAFAFAALVAGDAAILLRPEPYSTLEIYAIFSLFGWVVLVVPIVLIPADLVKNVPWPIWALIGLALGPLALAIAILILSRGHIEGFSRTGPFFPISMLVSIVAAVVYRALLRAWPESSA